MKKDSFDVCVVGAGPSGSMIASRLARLNYDVALVAQTLRSSHRFPESMSPGVDIFMEHLDLKHRLQEISFECERTSICWEHEEPAIQYQSHELRRLVDRNLLDTCLIESARDAGVELIESRLNRHCVEQADNGWHFTLAGKHRRRFRARFVVWANGRKTLFGRMRRRRTSYLIALKTYWVVAVPFTRSSIVMESLRNGWIWSAEIAGGNKRFAILFLDPREKNSDRSRCLSSTFANSISESKLVRWDNSAAPVTGCDASSSMACDVIGKNWLCVGDSAITLEPISSQGIQVALKLGYQGAIVVHTILGDPGRAALASTFYKSQVSQIALGHTQSTNEFYGAVRRFPGEPFWRNRDSLGSAPNVPTRVRARVNLTKRLELSQDATFTETPCLIGESIRQIPAIEHPDFTHPIAYIGNIPLSELLGHIEARPSGAALCRKWAGLTSRPLNILEWFLTCRILQYVKDDTESSDAKDRAGGSKGCVSEHDVDTLGAS